MVTRPVVDGHNDLPWAMRKVGYDFSARDIAQPQPELHTDLGRLRAGGVAGQFWSVYVPCSYRGADAVTATLEQIDAVHSMVGHYPHALALVTSAEGLQLDAQSRADRSPACSGPRAATASTTPSAPCDRCTGSGSAT